VKDSPRFKVGDEVKWVCGAFDRGRIVLGPFAPGLREVGDDCGPRTEYSYAIRFGEAFRVLSDSSLAPVSNWVPCPGEHRHTGLARAAWERLEP
jgi:hypothetical protein